MFLGIVLFAGRYRSGEATQVTQATSARVRVVMSETNGRRMWILGADD